MAIVLTAGSRTGSIAQLITVLFIFILVLLITALTTRFVGGYQKMQGKNRNLEIIESARIANNKYVQIVRAADKYIVIGVGKNEVSMLTEIDGDMLINAGNENAFGTSLSKESFSEIINKAKASLKGQGTDSPGTSDNQESGSDSSDN